MVAFFGSLVKFEINGSDETRRKLKTSSFVDVSDYFPRKTSSEVLEIIVSKFLGVLGQVPNRQNGPRNNIGYMDQYFMNKGWHVGPWVFFNK